MPDHSTLQSVRMIQSSPALMTSSWEERKSWVGLKESMTQLFWEKEPLPRELTRKQSRTTLTASSTEPIPTVVEESVWRESLCFSAVWKTSETLLFSQEIPRESLHESIDVYHLFIIHVLKFGNWIYWIAKLNAIIWFKILFSNDSYRFVYNN